MAILEQELSRVLDKHLRVGDYDDKISEAIDALDSLLEEYKIRQRLREKEQ